MSNRLALFSGPFAIDLAQPPADTSRQLPSGVAFRGQGQIKFAIRANARGKANQLSLILSLFPFIQDQRLINEPIDTGHPPTTTMHFLSEFLL